MRGLLVVVAWGVYVAGTCGPPRHRPRPCRGDHRLDCEDWRYGPADEPVLPAEYDRDDYKRTSLRAPEFAASPQNLCGQKRRPSTTAWGLSRGIDDVRIAVLDSGIKCGDAGDMADLATTA